MAACLVKVKECHHYWQACITQVRYRRIRSRNPREPHFERKYILEACKPVYIREKRPDWETCRKRPEFLPEPRLHPYEQLLAKELMKEWKASRMICFFHSNPIAADEAREVKSMLYKQNMHIRQYNRGVIKLALKNTFYESALAVFQTNTAIVYCAEPNVSKLLSLSRKMPQYILLAGIIDDHFLSREDLQQYSTLPSLETMQCHLSNTLTSPLNKVSTNLSYQYSQLSRLLRQYLDQTSLSSNSENTCNG